MMSGTRNTVYAFLKYQDTKTIKRIDLYYSFIFQLLIDQESLRPVLEAAHDSNY